jgi:hypothetical protein
MLPAVANVVPAVPGYAAEIVTTFSSFADDALALGQVRPGERVLDVGD